MEHVSLPLPKSRRGRCDSNRWKGNLGQVQELLLDQKMDYSKKKYELSEVRSRMNYFTYTIQKTDLMYSDKIGELYMIEDGEKYFQNGRLDKMMLEGKDGTPDFL